MNTMNRRSLLQSALFGAGACGLASIATGLPISFFRDGIIPDARAQSALPPQFLIMLSNGLGDPINVSSPGAQGMGGNAVYNSAPSMAVSPLQMGGLSTTAALPWTTIPAASLARMNVVHHRTYQNAHPQYPKVMRLTDNARGPDGSGTEHLVSVLGQETSEALGTIQREPISLTNDITFEGRTLSAVRPTTLASMFSPKEGIGVELAEIRRTHLDGINAMLRAEGTSEQRRWLDRFASSHEQVVSLDQNLAAGFANIGDDTPAGQIAAAVLLIQMKVAPAIMMYIPMGGDNHFDSGLVIETAEHQSGFAFLVQLLAALETAGLSDSVTISNLHAFGRTFRLGRGGRNHNLNHHAMCTIGANVVPCIGGGVAPSGNDFGAVAIDSETGQGGDGGDIPVTESLEAAAKTLGAALGIARDRLDTRIVGGKVIEAAVAS